MKAKMVHYTGKVQGVGFRMIAVDLALKQAKIINKSKLIYFRRFRQRVTSAGFLRDGHDTIPI